MTAKINPETYFENRTDRPICAECPFYGHCQTEVANFNQAVEKYPHVCTHCNGSGQMQYTENGAPHGEGYWPMDFTEICPACVDHNTCPRCASDLSYYAGYAKCEACKWDEEDDGAVIPENPYCHHYPTYD